jgi:hypothetical protein
MGKVLMMNFSFWLSNGEWKSRKERMENELRLHSPVGAEPVIFTWPISSSVRGFYKFDQYTFVLNFPFFHVSERKTV